jgi:predicted AAA+ superfamily ATPase
VYILRTLEGYVKKAARQVPVLLVTGARQVGKTTLLRHASARRRAYVSLDDPLVLRLAREDPALFMQRFPPPVLIDEIQYAPALLPYIKIAVDRAREPGLFWLTGSQQFHLMKGVSESLAGRVGVVQLLGLSRRELLRRESLPFLPRPARIHALHASSGRFGLKALFELIWRGSFPVIALNKKADWQLFYGSYVQTYLQRDIRDLARVGDEMAFLRFLRAAAARTGQLLNLSELARDADVAPNTAKHWLSILQASGIVYLLEPYHTNLTKRLVKVAKLYFLDTGLCAYLTGWSTPETLEAGAMSGAILETWVVTELLKGYWHNGLAAPFYYYRDKDRKEIDLLIVQNGTVYPLEIKKSAAPSRDDVRHFPALDRLKRTIGPGGVICLTRDVLPLTETVHAIPVSAL